MAWPVGPLNNATTTINGTTYIYNSTTNAWSISTPTYSSVSNILTVGNSIVTGNLTANTIVYSPAMANGNSNVTIAANSTVAIAANGAVRVTTDANGNVGVGTNSPNTRLQVYKAATSAFTGTSPGAFIVTDSTNTLNYFTSIDFNTTNAPSVPYARIGMSYTSGGSTLSFGTSNSYASGITNTAMTIDPTGNLLVGTTLTNLYAQTSGKGLCYRNSASLDVLVTSDNAMILNRTTTTGQIVEFRYSGTAVGSISVTGSTTAYNTSSDYRLKNSIVPITSGLATVAALKPVTYKWNADDSDGEGFIAHELAEVIPLAVTGAKDAVDADGNPVHQGVDYSKIVVHLVAAIQELSAEVEALKAKVGA